ncbi:nucleoside-diphosphate-sugar epimerase [Ancylobacter aquaticus]|uniref:Nucleoside-diphosphate-sugar epimerase n=1 Tax=Ancylobacter aquaticus TaxID=100 RepID=A0A4V2PH88_ANCAQ|nr:NAD(P)-dependent oxidoreductase [Ancylobacter aquaticus]TCK19766.1 nucleoside-diphosphate-sugar epimerase [Ancylobacter aquaticus]
MGLNVFLAGASGVIGRSLVPLLLDAGHTVTGMSRSPEGKATLEAMGIGAAVVADVFDAEAVKEAVWTASPDVLIHQLTDLSGNRDAASPEEKSRRNARLRRQGTANLVAAATAASVKRIVAQSIGWAYAPKPPPFVETDPLDLEATDLRAITVSGIAALESAILDQAAFEGIILRYGQLYGPGTWSVEPVGAAPLHIEAAAYAAFLAVDHGRPGAYNIAKPGGALEIEKSLNELGWRPDFRIGRQA